MSNAIVCMDNRFASRDLWSTLSGLDIELEQSENDNSACKKSVHHSYTVF